jgi:prepilin-type processing-associated H-X9-DG protein
MKLPRVRFRLRTLAIAVAVAAALLTASRGLVSAKAAGLRAECANNLKLISLFLDMYESGHGTFPPGTVPHAALSPERRLSWWAHLAGFLEQGFLLLFDLDEPWDAGANRAPRAEHTSTTGDPPPYTTPIGDFSMATCPACRPRTKGGGAAPTQYVGIAGLGIDAPTLPPGHPRAGVFGYDRRTRVAEITDGASTTLMLAETTLANGPWTAGGPATVRGVDPGRTPYIGPGRQFGGAHPGGANVAFADGSVRFLGEAIDPKVFEALSTIAGGEALPPGWDGEAPGR